MNDRWNQQRAAIEAVARHFSAAWEARGDDAAISLAGKRIALDVAVVEQRIASQAGLARLHLRLDKVVRRLVDRLRDNLHSAVPRGRVVLATMTAPIRLAARTTMALEASIRDCLAGGAAQAEYEANIHGNQVRLRIVESSARLASNVIVFVHNPGTDAGRLLDIARLLLHYTDDTAGKRLPAQSASERWLVMVIAGEVEQMATYRQLYAQLSIASDFAMILMVFGGERVETLVG